MYDTDMYDTDMYDVKMHDFDVWFWCMILRYNIELLFFRFPYFYIRFFMAVFCWPEKLKINMKEWISLISHPEEVATLKK